MKSQYTDSITGNALVDIRVVNNAIFDLIQTPNKQKATIIGDPLSSIVSSDQIKFGEKSIYFGHKSSGNYGLSTHPFEQVSGDFTYQFWMYIQNKNLPSSNSIYIATTLGFDNSTKEFSITLKSNITNPHLKFWTSSNDYSSSYYFSTYTDQWMHFCLARSGYNLFVFVNGVKVQTITNSSSYYFTGNLEYINLYTNQIPENAGQNIPFYADDIVFINNQCLWTDNFEVPNYYLLGDTNSNYEQRIYPERNIPTITGDVVLDARVTKDKKIRNYGSISYTGGYRPSKLNAKIVSDTSPLGDLYSVRSKIKCDSTSTQYTQFSFFKPKTTLTLPVGSTTSKFTTSVWIKLNPVISNISTWNQFLMFQINDGTNWLSIPVWYITENNPGMQIGYNGGSCYYYNPQPTASLPNQWVHMAFVKDGINLYTFINGINYANSNLNSPIGYKNAYKFVSDNFNMNVAVIAIQNGNRYHNSVSTFYVDDIVLIKDQALWTSNFTPPNDYLTGYKALSDGEIVIDPLYHASVFDY